MTYWEFKGRELVNCTCEYGCNCQFNALPDKGHCHAVAGNPDRQGHHGDTPLDGLKIAALFKWPGPIHEGHGEALAFVDERADEAQREALLEDHDRPGHRSVRDRVRGVRLDHRDDARAGVRRHRLRGRRRGPPRPAQHPRLCRDDRRADPQQGRPARNRARRSASPTASNMKWRRSAARPAGRPAGRCRSRSTRNTRSSPTCICRPTVSSTPDLTQPNPAPRAAGRRRRRSRCSRHSCWWYPAERRGACPAARWPDGQPPLAALVLMWWLMMAAMMLPSAAPAILLYARVRQMRSGDCGDRRRRGCSSPAISRCGCSSRWPRRSRSSCSTARR